MTLQSSYPVRRQDFHDDGYLFLSGFLRGSEIAEMLANLNRFIGEVLPLIPAEHVYYEDPQDPATLKQIQQLGEHDPYFRFSQGIIDFPTAADSESEIACPAQAGDLLAHHALTIHRADHNRSRSRSRQALGFILLELETCAPRR